jgi:hypothetical protein
MTRDERVVRTNVMRCWAGAPFAVEGNNPQNIPNGDLLSLDYLQQLLEHDLHLQNADPKATVAPPADAAPGSAQ